MPSDHARHRQCLPGIFTSVAEEKNLKIFGGMGRPSIVCGRPCVALSLGFGGFVKF